jgi:hypothetical protein
MLASNVALRLVPYLSMSALQPTHSQPNHVLRIQLVGSNRVQLPSLNDNRAWGQDPQIRAQPSQVSTRGIEHIHRQPLGIADLGSPVADTFADSMHSALPD